PTDRHASPSIGTAAVAQCRVHSLAVCASAEGVCRPTIAGASWTSSSFCRASTMNRAKSTRRVRLLLRMGSPTCRLHTGRPWLSPSSRSLARTAVHRVSLANTRRHASTWSSHPVAPGYSAFDDLAFIRRSRNDSNAPLEGIKLLHAALAAHADHRTAPIQRVLHHVDSELPRGPDDADLHRVRQAYSWVTPSG